VPAIYKTTDGNIPQIDKDGVTDIERACLAGIRGEFARKY
jgi:hypothetical protein